VYDLPLTCPNNIQGEQQICSYLQAANNIIELCVMAPLFHIATRELPETSKHLFPVKTIHGTAPPQLTSHLVELKERGDGEGPKMNAAKFTSTPPNLRGSLLWHSWGGGR
jgi:hypothetical protein